MKYNEWIKTWLEYYAKPSVKHCTYRKYTQIAKVHLVPALGNMQLKYIDAITLQKFTVTLAKNGNIRTNNGLATSTINSIISMLQKSLKTAVLVGAVNKQYSDSITRPKNKEKEIDCFSISEQKRIEQYILHSKKVKLYGIVICLYTGLRLGELMALTSADIDTKNLTISVNKTCYYGINENNIFTRIIDTPKTRNSKRIIPYPKQLNGLIKELTKNKTCNSIICNKDKPISNRSYQRTFERLLRKLDIPHKGFHSLRHTFATRAIASGMDVKTLSEILGHTNSIITLNRYVHSPLPHKADMMNKLGKMLACDD